MDVRLRLAFNIVWLAAFAAVLARQRVLSCSCPFVDFGALRRRMRRRLCGISNCNCRGCLPLGCNALMGSCLLMAVGFGTGFCWWSPPPEEGLKMVLLTFAQSFIMPGIVEEVLFRGLLLRLPADIEQLERQEQPPVGGPERALAVQLKPPSADGIGASSEELCDDAASTAASAAAPAMSALSVSSSVAMDRAAQTDATNYWCGGSRPPAWEQVAALAIFVIYHCDLLHEQTVFQDWRFLCMAVVLGVFCQEALLVTGTLWPSVLLHTVWVTIWVQIFGGRDLFMDPDAAA
eukprot:TRINITY_DN100808_c0_g1_i1.p1 TRINITY_DN100808_c0_g1~~TRINITY_DN100808_c0_g1_i1.p1  ORF type:complete len:291 (+),score=74.44 TRINITY_DN100808_c0_g1_i1:149-1021(+)